MLLLKRHKNDYTYSFFKYKDIESEIFVIGYSYKGKESKWSKLGTDENAENGIKFFFWKFTMFLFCVLIYGKNKSKTAVYQVAVGSLIGSIPIKHFEWLNL